MMRIRFAIDGIEGGVQWYSIARFMDTDYTNGYACGLEESGMIEEISGGASSGFLRVEKEKFKGCKTLKLLTTMKKDKNGYDPDDAVYSVPGADATVMYCASGFREFFGFLPCTLYIGVEKTYDTSPLWPVGGAI